MRKGWITVFTGQRTLSLVGHTPCHGVIPHLNGHTLSTLAVEVFAVLGVALSEDNLKHGVKRGPGQWVGGRKVCTYGVIFVPEDNLKHGVAGSRPGGGSELTGCQGI